MTERGPKSDSPGREWRLLAHEEAGEFEARNRGVFDELVVDDWLHVEQMQEREWWIQVGDARLLVTIESGRVRVDIERGFYASTTGETVLESQE